MAKTFYFKLSKVSSIFYDPKNKLKVTKGVPGKTDNKTKQTADAQRNGHIIEISEDEYNKMLTALPEETRKATIKDHAALPKKKVEPKKEVPNDDEDEEEGEDDNTGGGKREELIERLKALNLSDKNFKKKSKLSDEELEEYLNANEEE